MKTIHRTHFNGIYNYAYWSCLLLIVQSFHSSFIFIVVISFYVSKSQRSIQTEKLNWNFYHARIFYMLIFLKSIAAVLDPWICKQNVYWQFNERMKDQQYSHKSQRRRRQRRQKQQWRRQNREIILNFIRNTIQEKHLSIWNGRQQSVEWLSGAKRIFMRKTEQFTIIFSLCCCCVCFCISMLWSD